MSINTSLYASGTGGGKYLKVSSIIGGLTGGSIGALTGDNTFKTAFDTSGGGGILDSFTFSVDANTTVNVEIVQDGTTINVETGKSVTSGATYVYIGANPVPSNSQYIGSGSSPIPFKTSMQVNISAPTGTITTTRKATLGTWENL